MLPLKSSNLDCLSSVTLAVEFFVWWCGKRMSKCILGIITLGGELLHVSTHRNKRVSDASGCSVMDEQLVSLWVWELPVAKVLLIPHKLCLHGIKCVSILLELFIKKSPSTSTVIFCFCLGKRKITFVLEFKVKGFIGQTHRSLGTHNTIN